MRYATDGTNGTFKFTDDMLRQMVKDMFWNKSYQDAYVSEFLTKVFYTTKEKGYTPAQATEIVRIFNRYEMPKKWE